MCSPGRQGTDGSSPTTASAAACPLRACSSGGAYEQARETLPALPGMVPAARREQRREVGGVLPARLVAVVATDELGDERRIRRPPAEVDNLGGRYAYCILISMSTPAGRSRRCRESTVLGLCSTMSSRRLWMRISKCSRLSLYLWGERITV